VKEYQYCPPVPTAVTHNGAPEEALSLATPVVVPKTVCSQSMSEGALQMNWAESTPQQREAAIVKNEPNLVKVFIKKSGFG
jgi:hypothetical protein